MLDRDEVPRFSLRQMKLMPAGVENLVLISDEARRKVHDVARGGAGGVNSKDGEQTSERKKWRVGEMEFEALMRSLDNAVSNFFASL